MLFSVSYYFLPRFGTFRIYSLGLDGVRLKGIELSEFGDQTVVFIAKTPVKLRQHVSHILKLSWGLFQHFET